MSDQLSAASEGMDVPEDLVMRSARARAAAAGSDVDTVLAAWAGGEAAPAAAEPAPADAPSEEPEAAEEQPTTTPETEPETETPAPSAEPAEPPVGAGAVTPVPAPATVTPEEALDYDVVVSVPTAGLKERTSTTIPQWLVAALLIVPMFGLLYLASNGTADATCEEGGLTLRVDRATGLLENCDGSAFEGRGGASGGTGEFIALGSELYATCSGCHGANGGGGTGPAFGGVMTTFGSCTDHVEWVRLGSAGFQAEGRNSYGDTGVTIQGGMPGFPNLTEEEIAAVVAFERIRFGGGEADAVLTDCGLLGGEAEGGDGGEGGDAPAEETPADAMNEG